MPKRKEPPPTSEEQSERFRSEIERLIAAGELNPTEADAELESLVKGQRLKKG